MNNGILKIFIFYFIVFPRELQANPLFRSSQNQGSPCYTGPSENLAAIINLLQDKVDQVVTFLDLGTQKEVNQLTGKEAEFYEEMNRSFSTNLDAYMIQATGRLQRMPGTKEKLVTGAALAMGAMPFPGANMLGRGTSSVITEMMDRDSDGKAKNVYKQFIHERVARASRTFSLEMLKKFRVVLSTLSVESQDKLAKDLAKSAVLLIKSGELNRLSEANSTKTEIERTDAITNFLITKVLEDWRNGQAKKTGIFSSDRLYTILGKPHRVNGTQLLKEAEERQIHNSLATFPRSASPSIPPQYESIYPSLGPESNLHLATPSAPRLSSFGLEGELGGLERAASQGDPDALYHLGVLYSTGAENLKSDTQKGFDLLRKSADLNNPKAQNYLGQIYLMHHDSDPSNLSQAKFWLEKAEHNRDFYAPFNLAKLHQIAGSPHYNESLAAAWFEKAARAGHHQAQFELGELYRHGRGTPVDLEKAKEWYEVASKNGVPDADFALGLMEENAERVSAASNKANALVHFERAAEKNHPDAQYRVANIYLKGQEGVEPNLEKYTEWLKKASDNNLPQAQFALAEVYTKGNKTLKKNDQLAFGLYEKAAQQGFMGADQRLAGMYLSGKGTVVNSEKGMEIYQSKISQSDSNAAAAMELFEVANKNGLSSVAENLKTIIHQKEVESLKLNGESSSESSRKLAETPLYSAIQNSKSDLAKYLIGQKFNLSFRHPSTGETLLHAAVRNGDLEIIKSLIDKKLDVNATSNNLSTPLTLAIEKGDVTVAKLLLKNSANINLKFKNDSTPLQLAVLKGNREMVELLLNNNADPNTLSSKRTTPLIVAVTSGREDLTDILLPKVSDLNLAGANHMTALHFAVLSGHSKMVEKLVAQKGINLNSVDSGGNTPLALAIQQNNPELAKYLAGSKCNLKAVNNKGKSILDLAKDSGNPAIINRISRLLLEKN
jgi:TPR repeat protein